MSNLNKEFNLNKTIINVEYLRNGIYEDLLSKKSENDYIQNNISANNCEKSVFNKKKLKFMKYSNAVNDLLNKSSYNRYFN